MAKILFTSFIFCMNNYSQNYYRINFKSYLKKPIKVDDKLMRGCCVTTPWKLFALKKAGVTQIIDLRNNSLKKVLEKLFCKIFNIKYINFKYSHRLDYLPQQDFFEKVNNTILENKGMTYMHCEKGKRRSGICQAFYELFCLDKSKQDIKNNLLNFGFREFFEHSETKRAQKYQKIFNEFIEKYLFQGKN